jgi:hypothetical protein
VHLRGHNNINKRLLIHACGLNLGLLMRALYGVGTPRGMQDGGFQLFFVLLLLLEFYVITDCRQSGMLQVTSGQDEKPIHPSRRVPQHLCPIQN